MEIRRVRESDAEAVLALFRRLDEETAFMMHEPGERTTTVDEQRAHIRRIAEADTQLLLVADAGDGRLVGFLAATGGMFRRNRHGCYLVMGILQAYTGKGLGTQLFEALDGWVAARKLHRLELTVMTHNAPAIALYLKMGFQIEGTRKHSLRVGDQWFDEYLMAKLLTPAKA